MSELTLRILLSIWVVLAVVPSSITDFWAVAVVGEKGVSTQMSQSGISFAYKPLPATVAMCMKLWQCI